MTPRRLTPRERELILRCSEPGATQEAVAEALGISVSTIRNTLQKAYLRLGVRTREEALAAIELGVSLEGGGRSHPAPPRLRMNAILRFTILERDRFTCQYCGRKAPDVPLEVDHVIAKANGGVTEAANLVTACYDCNQGKHSRILAS